jgi:hypothetical protein
MITLEDIVPQPAKFKISRMNKEYTLRPFSLADELWVKSHFGEHASKMFTDVDLEKICQLAFHQFIEREDFKLQIVKFVDDNGHTVQTEIGGWKLLMTLIAGPTEVEGLIKAILQTQGLSSPILDQISKEQDDIKKKMRPIGQPSSMSSQPSTVGRRNTSSRARLAKSSTV